MFPLFLKKTAVVLTPRLVVFLRLLRLGSFPVYWRVPNVTLIPKSQPSSTASNYRPISLTPILSKVFERLVSVCLGRFMEGRGVLPTTQFANRSQFLANRLQYVVVKVPSSIARSHPVENLLPQNVGLIINYLQQ